MAKCLNCGASITCGCQKRTASDGKACCSSCVATYEKKLKVARPTTVSPIKTNSNKFSF